MSTVEDRLRALIEVEGPITFARFMEEALYGEGGYYCRENLAIGVAGDFITGSSYSSLFGRATARLLGRLDGVLGRPADFLEVGYGDGSHLRGWPRLWDRRMRADCWLRSGPATAAATD